MKRNKGILLGLIIILVTAVAILAYLNRSQMTLTDDQGERLVIKEDGKVTATVDKDMITGMKSEEFSAVLRGGGRPSENHSYTGVSVKVLIEKQKPGIMNGKKQVTFKGIDGYVSAFTASEILDPDNVYLVYKEDGKELKGKNQGGTGPFKIIARKDEFGQRWCKFLSEIEVK